MEWKVLGPYGPYKQGVCTARREDGEPLEDYLRGVVQSYRRYLKRGGRKPLSIKMPEEIPNKVLWPGLKRIIIDAANEPEPNTMVKDIFSKYARIQFDRAA